MADKNIKIAVILTAIDKMTAVVNKANKNAKNAFNFGKTSAITGAAFAAPIIYATNKAIEFEDKMADVAKVYNTKIGDSTFLQLGEQAKDLSVYLSKSANESAALMASLGQGGVAQSDLDKVSKSAGQIAVAFDLSADIAGDRYTKLKNALNSSWDETKKVSDAINYLSDNQASKASEILDFMAAGGAGVARNSRTAGKDLAAMGSYLISVGKSGAESATIVERFYKGIMKNNGARDIFTRSGEGMSGFMSVLEKGASISDPGKKFQYFKQFGEYSTELMSMAGNMDQLKASVGSVADETSFLNSVQKEFENRNSTTKGKMAKGWAEFNRIVLDFGTNGLPVILELLATLRPIVQSVSDWMRSHKELNATIFKAVAGAAALSFTVSALSFAFGGVFKVIAVTTTGLKWLRAGQLAYSTATLVGATTTGSLTMALRAMNLAFLANPVYWVVAGVAALIAGFILLYKHCDAFRAFIDGVIAAGRVLLDLFIGIGKTIIGAFTFNPAMFMEGVEQSAKAAQDIFTNKSFDLAYKASMATSTARTASEIADKTSTAATPASRVSGFQIKAPEFGPTNSTKLMTFAPVIHLNGSATKKDAKLIADALTPHVIKIVKEHNLNKKRVAY
jgi:TP901 family phage tail tape measure protein